MEFITLNYKMHEGGSLSVMRKYSCYCKAEAKPATQSCPTLEQGKGE